MAKILPDRDVRKFLGSVLIGADEKHINPNGIELCLGSEVRFYSTGESKKLEIGLFLKVRPGETVLISSLEKLDFTAETVQKIHPDKMLMAFVTPTTTMMREGISNAATKVDTGFRGNLNWAFRNSSTHDFIVGYGEPIFKLTLFLLGPDESPDVPYGQSQAHTYQDTEGIKSSQRRIPAEISPKSFVASGIDKIDPRKQLKEAGYPFDHIGTELVALHGKFEIVSKDVIFLKDHLEKQADTLSAKINEETEAISNQLDMIFNKVDSLFQTKFGRTIGILVGAMALMAGAYKYLCDKEVAPSIIVMIGFVVGSAILVITYVVTASHKVKHKQEKKR